MYQCEGITCTHWVKIESWTFCDAVHTCTFVDVNDNLLLLYKLILSLSLSHTHTHTRTHILTHIHTSTSVSLPSSDCLAKSTQGHWRILHTSSILGVYLWCTQWGFYNSTLQFYNSTTELLNCWIIWILDRLLQTDVYSNHNKSVD